MLDDPKVEHLLTEVSVEFMGELKLYIQRAFRAGVEAGIQKYKTELLGSLHGAGLLPQASAVSIPGDWSNYGQITALVRQALQDAASLEGSRPRDVLVYCIRCGQTELSLGQVRSALKGMVKTGEAKRVVRGKYRIALNTRRAEAASDHPNTIN